MRRMILASVVVFLTGVVFAGTTIVPLETVADSDVRADLADAYGSRDNHKLDARVANASKAYLRFEIPTDLGPVSNATLSFVIYEVTAYDTDSGLYGLNDGESGQEWLETTGYVSNPSGGPELGLTWKNAPGNDTNSATGFITDDTTSLGSVTITGGGAVGEVITISGSNLVAFLNADTDGIVNLMLNTQNTSTDWLGIASKEHATLDAPVLTLEYPFSSIIAETDATGDADVRIDIPDEANGVRTHVYLDARATKAAKGYLRFQLPDDIDTLLNATLTVVVDDPPYWNCDYNFYGLNDGASGQGWFEATNYLTGIVGGPENGLCWNNAPGNDTNSYTGFLPADTTSLGSAFVSGSNYGGAAGDVITISGAALVDFLLTDTDGIVNLMLSTSNASTDWTAIASRENLTYAAPKLTLQYLSTLSYPIWIQGYPGVGAETAKTDDPDGDGLDNLGEWALGGNPDDAGDKGHVPDSEIVDLGGGTYILQYVHAKRSIADGLGLTYWVEQSLDLVTPDWTNNVGSTGTGALDANFDTVTNVVTTTEAKKFLRLRVESE